MATSIAVTSPNFESFIFAQGNDLKTNSLKIAEAFDKDHSNVLKVIDRIVSQVSDSFREVNFNFSEYTQTNSLGKAINYRSYELTKDGFIMVVMSFTGAKAMAVKESYINAFNMMREKLFSPSTLQLEPPTITKAQSGELCTRIVEMADLTDNPKKTRLALWSRFNKHFRIGGYKELPREKYDDAIAYLELKKLNYPATKEPEMKRTSLQGYASMILGTNGNHRLVVQEHNDTTVIMKLNPEDFAGTFETVVRELKMQGYVVMKKDELVEKLSVLAA